MSARFALEVVGWLSSALIILSLAQARVLRFRVLNLAGAILAVFYNLALQIWPFVAMNAIIAVLNTYWLRRLLRERHDSGVYEVVEVAPDDQYLGHVMKVHLDDVRRFQPGFAWDPSTADRSAFLVERSTETVGVVVVRDVGNGIAQVELDYVTPRFRDFTPGEFVYQRSGVFAERGFRRLVAPANVLKPEAYFPHVGFHREDGQWVRDIDTVAA
jgi:hypothetical protein